MSKAPQQSIPAAGTGESKGRTPQFAAISRERHAGKKWQRFSNFGFASASTMVPIVGAEVAQAALALPLAFLQEAGRFLLVAVLSPAPGRNMFVAPNGRWLGSYIPGYFRCYPFRLFPKPQTDQALLCIDEDLGLVVEGSSSGEDFFDQNGHLSPALQRVFDFLGALERSRRITDVAVTALAEAGLIQPWPLKVKIEQADRTVAGLHHIDEVALNGLADDAFLKLRKTPAALPIAYAQLLSTGHLGVFDRLARLQAQLRPPPAAALPENLDSLFELPADDTVRFR